MIQFSKSKGLSVTATHPNRSLLEVTGKVADIEKVFYLKLRQYRRADGSLFHAPDKEPSLDLDVPLLHIGGLENYALSHPLYTPAQLKHNRTDKQKVRGCFLKKALLGA